MTINSRRYTGSKYWLLPQLRSIMRERGFLGGRLFDVFGGTGVVTAGLLQDVDSAVINDFLYSNEIIYKAFFRQEAYDADKLQRTSAKYNSMERGVLQDNWVSVKYGGKYFSRKDAALIGYIREDIAAEVRDGALTAHEGDIMMASLLYSLDKCANTVGHYDAYIKGREIADKFVMELIEPIKTDKRVEIYREDANALSRSIDCDAAFVDPPYNSRQYSRFYHVLETITKWDKPALSGAALKPPLENMSSYCKVSAPDVFKDLIEHLLARHIVVTYNNTYDSKSSSSRNKITLEEIRDILHSKGHTEEVAIPHHRFNAGKTYAPNHKEIVFLTEVLPL